MASKVIDWTSAVDTVSELPSSGNQIGDCRMVVSPPGGLPPTPYTWNGTNWISAREGGLSGPLRLYVDGTNGDDTASGLSWTTAWKTYSKLEHELGEILSANPTNLQIRVFLRGDFAGQDLNISGTLAGNSMLDIVHHIDDWTEAKTGTVATRATAASPLGLCELTFAGLTLDSSDEGRIVVLEDGTGKRIVYTIIRVWDNGGTPTATIMDRNATVPAWVTMGVLASIRYPSLGTTAPGTLSYSLRVPYKSNGIRKRFPVVLGAVCSGLQVTHSTSQLAVYKDGSLSAEFVESDARTYVYNSSTMVFMISPGDAQEYGLLGTNTSESSYVGSVLRGSSVALTASSGYVAAFGYFDGSLFATGGTVAAGKCLAKGMDAQGGHLSLGYGILRGRSGATSGFSVSHQAEGVISNAIFVDVPSAGYTDGMLQSRRGSNLRLDSTVSGNNTGTGSDLYAVKAYDGGMVQFNGAPSTSLVGKHGFLKVVEGRVKVSGNLTRNAMEGAGPDIYVEAGDLHVDGNVTKSAVNTTASPVLVVARGGRVTQSSGKTFTLATPAADWNTSYGADGAIVAKDGPVDVRLGTLSGGAAGTTGVGCTLRYGARLAHAGTGLSGTAPLLLGGSGAIAWPAAITSDLSAGTPEDCWVYPNV